jgi:hypothetical protein
MTASIDPSVARLQVALKDANDIAFTTLRANGELGVVINFLEKSFLQGSCRSRPTHIQGQE